VIGRCGSRGHSQCREIDVSRGQYSAAKPKTGRLSLSTLHPHLASSDLGPAERFGLATSLGLIEGAAEGPVWVTVPRPCRTLRRYPASRDATTPARRELPRHRGELDAYGEADRKPEIRALTKCEDTRRAELAAAKDELESSLWPYGLFDSRPWAATGLKPLSLRSINMWIKRRCRRTLASGRIESAGLVGRVPT